MSQSKEKKELFYGLWIIAGGFVLLFLFAGAGFYSFSIFIKPLETHFGWSRASISFTMSLYLIVSGIASPFVGHLTETYGPKRVMTFFALASGTFFILVSFTQSLWYFYLIYALLSVANSGIGIVPVSSLISKWFVRRRGTATGVTMVGLAVGGFVMAPLTGLITAHLGWRWAFIFIGILVYLLALPVTLFIIKGNPADKGLLPDGDKPDNHLKKNRASNPVNITRFPEKKEWTLKTAVKTKEFFFIALSFFLAPLSQAGLLQHQVPLIIEAGMTETSAALALGLTAGLGGLGKLSFGRISEILPFHYAVMLCFGLQAFAAFILFRAQSITMVWAYVFIFGFAMGGTIVLLPLSVGHFFGLKSFGVILGTMMIVQAFGASSGGLISGLVYDHLGSYDYAVIAYILTYFTAAGAIFLTGKSKLNEAN